MKKYKLIKEYPGSPELGTIAEKFFNSELYFLGQGRKTLAEFVENQPEYWQEIKEPDYEILSIRHKDGSVKNIYTKQNSTHYDWKQYILFEKGKHDFLEINSVKRLSDGEIFTIGDEYEDCDLKNQMIVEFNISSENGLLINSSLLKNVNHTKKPVFTTVDGKEIFAGDPFYVYDKHFYKCINTKGGQFQNERWTNYRYANKDTVLNLVFRNTPCLSLEDVASIYKTANREKPENSNDQGTKLYNLVRQKLNK